jgi:hypothetical protein
LLGKLGQGYSPCWNGATELDLGMVIVLLYGVAAFYGLGSDNKLAYWPHSHDAGNSTWAGQDLILGSRDSHNER